MLAIALGILPQQTLFNFMNGTLNQIVGLLSHSREMVDAAATLTGGG